MEIQHLLLMHWRGTNIIPSVSGGSPEAWAFLRAPANHGLCPPRAPTHHPGSALPPTAAFPFSRGDPSAEPGTPSSGVVGQQGHQGLQDPPSCVEWHCHSHQCHSQKSWCCWVEHGFSTFPLPAQSHETPAQTACPCPHPHPPPCHHLIPKNSLLEASSERSQGHAGFPTCCCRYGTSGGRAGLGEGARGRAQVPPCPQMALPVAEQQQSSRRIPLCRTSCSPGRLTEAPE